MNFSSSRNIYIRRAVTAGLIFVTALFQHTGLFPEIFGASPLALIPLTVCIAMFERSIPGMYFGVLAGLLCDFATVRGDGFFSVMLTVTGFAAGALVTFVFRNNIGSALILSGGSLLICNICHWLLFIVRKGHDGAFQLLFGSYLPSVLYSLVFVFIYYYLMRYIFRAASENAK